MAREIEAWGVMSKYLHRAWMTRKQSSKFHKFYNGLGRRLRRVFWATNCRMAERLWRPDGT